MMVSGRYAGPGVTPGTTLCLDGARPGAIDNADPRSTTPLLTEYDTPTPCPFRALLSTTRTWEREPIQPIRLQIRTQSQSTKGLRTHHTAIR
jgi:hypothetical protein